jgi:hypothetical protein
MAWLMAREATLARTAQKHVLHAAMRVNTRTISTLDGLQPAGTTSPEAKAMKMSASNLISV